jgi:hypothetical protein
MQEMEAELVKSLLMALAKQRHGSEFERMEPVWGCQNVEDGIISQRINNETIVHQLNYNDPANKNTTYAVEIRTTLKPTAKNIWENIMPKYKPGILAG